MVKPMLGIIMRLKKIVFVPGSCSVFLIATATVRSDSATGCPVFESLKYTGMLVCVRQTDPTAAYHVLPHHRDEGYGPAHTGKLHITPGPVAGADQNFCHIAEGRV